MSELVKRIKSQAVLSKLMNAEDTIKFFKNGMNVGWSGFGSNGNPKIIPPVLADYVENNNLVGRMRFNLFTGGSVAPEIENRWAKAEMIDRRWPYQLGADIRKAVNSGAARMGDMHLGLFAEDLFNGFYTKESGGNLDIAIIEATAITEDAGIVLSTTVAAAPEIIQIADKVIIELNTAIPSFEGIHDIPSMNRPPFKKALGINRVCDRVGTWFVPCSADKIVAVVESTAMDNGPVLSPPDEISEKIADNILDFFVSEVKYGRLPRNLLPLQSGIGNIGNAVVGGLIKGPFANLQLWTEVMQDTMLDFFDVGKLDFGSTSGLTFSNKGFDRLYNNWEKYKNKVVLRPQQISNSAENIRRLGAIGMNTPIEFDIYGHANSTHAGGSRLINGIGGSGEFIRNSFLSIMHTPSFRPSKVDPVGISSVVPMVPHVDHTEHDINVLVTEQGLADLRGLCPTDRAQVIIDKCAHPDYRPILQEYFERAKKECFPKAMGHIPHMLFKVFKMQKNLEENGTMKINNWD